MMSILVKAPVKATAVLPAYENEEHKYKILEREYFYYFLNIYMTVKISKIFSFVGV